MKLSRLAALFLILPVLFLAGCASEQPPEEVVPEEVPQEETQEATPTPVDDTPPPPPPVSLPDVNTIYFDFDEYTIRGEFQTVLAGHAEYLANNPSAAVTIEGHCDERGTREYNIGLGERRANAVRQALTSQGASASQITTVSYGEERPVELGHDESAWSKNRRGEIVYTSQ